VRLQALYTLKTLETEAETNYFSRGSTINISDESGFRTQIESMQRYGEEIFYWMVIKCIFGNNKKRQSNNTQRISKTRILFLMYQPQEPRRSKI